MPLRQVERQLDAVDAKTARTLAKDERLVRRAETLASVPELGSLDAKAAASLAGLAPVARESASGRASASFGAGGTECAACSKWRPSRRSGTTRTSAASTAN